MAMFSTQKIKISYHTRLFLLLLAVSWVLVACFVAFQYRRERQYKIEKLDSQLQLYNSHLIDALSNDSIDFEAVVHKRPIAALRISVINADGTLAFDNTLDSLPGDSHLNRPEIREAMASGSGYTLRRHSSSTNNNYFYSATAGDGLIVRSAVPYSMSLQEILDADRSFLWFMLLVTLGISLLGYFATRRIGRTITRLNSFAEKAEKGESVYDTEPFPSDELGSISTHIIRLYARLQQTMEERDREHRKAIAGQQEKNRIKKQLTNNINHELKTPVAAIKICLETVLTHRDLPPAKHWEFLENSYGHTLRLVNLLNDVAAITRMDDGAANIEKSPLSLREIVDEVAHGFTPSLQRVGIKFECSLPHDMPIVGNRAFLSSIFRNLIDNAIAYSGGSLISLKLEAETDTMYRFAFSDNGCGIPDEHLERIFERFYRIDKGRSRLLGGTGLGLSIVRNAVKLHGGTISAANVVAGGIRFTFTLCKR